MLRSYQTRKQFKINKTTTIAISSISSLAILLLALFVLPLFSASESTHAASPTEPTISIIPASGITMDMTPAGGTAGSFGTATATVAISTTNTTGYIFTMNTETTSTDLKNSKIDYTNPSKADLKITNLTASTTESSFSPNKWGYNVNKNGTYIKGALGTYVPVPNSGSTDTDKQIEITDAPGNATYTFTYGVKANNNLPAGAYNNTLVFSATGNTIPVADCATETCTIVHDRNDSTSSNGIGATHANVKVGNTIQLFPVNDYKTNYGFAGWSTDSDAGTKVASSDAATRNSVTVYGPMETVTVTQDLLDENIHGAITLYAVWVAAPTTNGNPQTMQDFTTSNCDNLAQTTYSSGTITPGQITARKDSRDNNTYAIARLTDGKCWMMENLRLDQNITINSSNTQNPSITKTPANSTANWSSATTNALRNTNIASPASNPTAKTGNIYSYGVYYPWYTATAGRNPSSGATTGSICPYNWSLPISNDASTTVGSFGYLASTMDTTSATTKSSSFRHYPNNFLYSGRIYYGSINGRGSAGYHWSRTALDSSYAFSLYFDASNFNPSTHPDKYYGITIRCIAGS